MKKKILSMILAVTMLIVMVPFGAVTAFAESVSSVEYLDENGVIKGAVAEIITPDTTKLSEGTYIVSSNITVNSRIYVSGDVLIILADGHSLTASSGIGFSGDNTVHHTLTITSQSLGENMGILNACAYNDNSSAGIGSGYNYDQHTEDYNKFDIVINGGNITAIGGSFAAGIGSAFGNTVSSSCGNITINGGNITATGGRNAAGIGSGHSYNSGKSECGNITINGGNITAAGTTYGAGIGSGESAYCGNITVNGGNINAIGTSDGAGIGSDESAHCHDIAINGGCIKATCTRSGVAIGNNIPSRCGTVTYADNLVRKIEYDAEWINVTYKPGTAATCETSGYMDAYINLSDHMLYSAFPFTETAVGTESDYQSWIQPENGGYIPPLGHEWVSLEYYNQGHKCSRKGCNSTGAHADNDGDNKCDSCNCTVCSHENTVVMYDWKANIYTAFCEAKIKCNDCKAYVDHKTPTSIEFITDNPGTCIKAGNGHYKATFDGLNDSESDSIEIPTSDRHHYVDGECVDCHETQPLDGAKEDAKKAIETAAGENATLSVQIHVNGAKSLIDRAESIAEVLEIRNSCIADIESLTGATHIHIFSSDWNYNAINHWHDAICECDSDVISGFAAHSFGVGETIGNKTTYTCECGYEKVVYNDNEGELVSGISFTGISLTLGSDISINFYMNLTDDAKKNGTMTFDIGGRIVTVKGTDAKYNTKENRWFFRTPLTALEMAETITATFSCNGIDYTRSYSVKEYIEAIIGNSEDYDAKTVMLARKIANYGYYAQEYLASIHTNVTIADPDVNPNSGYDRMIHFADTPYDIDVDDAKSALASYGVSVTGTSANLSLYGSTVYFDSATALNYYVKAANGAKPEATCDGKTVTVTEYKGYTPAANEKVYIVSVKDIIATELADNITVTVNEEISITGSVFAYCNSVVKSHSGDTTGKSDDEKAKDAKAINAMAAFYEYCISACNYENKKVYRDGYLYFTSDAPDMKEVKISLNDISRELTDIGNGIFTDNGYVFNTIGFEERAVTFTIIGNSTQIVTPLINISFDQSDCAPMMIEITGIPNGQPLINVSKLKQQE